MHSATKYLNGHSDMVGGMVVVGDNAELAEQLPSCRTRSARVQGPFDSFLALRGLKTLHLRMTGALRERAGAGRVAGNASGDREGASTRACHRIRSTRWRKRQMDGFGGMVSICLKGGLRRRGAFWSAPNLHPRRSLGGVESLVNHPAIMTHASIPPDKRKALGIDDRWSACRSASRTSRTSWQI